MIKENKQADGVQSRRRSLCSAVVHLFSFLWSCQTMFWLPVSFEWICMDITGHGKGLSYDLGSEKEIGIFFGCIELLLWIFLCVPPLVHTLFRCKQKGIIPFLLVIFLFAALFALCIFVIYGGWNAFWEECSEII